MFVNYVLNLDKKTVQGAHTETLVLVVKIMMNRTVFVHQMVVVHQVQHQTIQTRR